MTVDVGSILLANVAYTLLGVGLAAALGVLDRRRGDMRGARAANDAAAATGCGDPFHAPSIGRRQGGP